MHEFDVFRFFAVAVAATALLGCAQSITNYAAPERAATELRQDRGRVILSAGAPAACLTGEYIIEVRRRGSLGFSGATSALVFVNAIQIRSDYTSHFGTLNVWQLTPGEYEIGQGNQPALAHFTLLAGETIYLGELLALRGCRGDSSVVINDRWDRDGAIIRDRNPALAGQPITRRIMEPGPARQQQEGRSGEGAP